MTHGLLISGILLTFFLGMYLNSIIEKRKLEKSEKERVNNIQSKFEEILKNLSLGNSRFKTRLNSTTYISSNLKDHGSVDIVYIMNKEDIAIFKGNDCIYLSNGVDREIIDQIIYLIEKRYNKEINNIVNFFGIIFNKPELERSIGLKWEDFEKSMNRIYEMSKNESFINNDAFNNEVNFDIDDILDKISRFGINSLTNEERNFLDDYSRY
jgi:hypothetical protein